MLKRLSELNALLNMDETEKSEAAAEVEEEEQSENE